MPRSFHRVFTALALTMSTLTTAADAAPPGYCAPRVGCQCQDCRDRDPCRHHSAFIREMRCTCRDYVSPAGTKLYGVLGQQIANGTASRLVLYHYDFLPRDARLNYRGQRQLRKLVRMMARTTSPLIIQPTPGRPELDELRRKLVVAQASTLNMPLPLERVIVAPSPVHGLDGVDAVFNHDRLLQLMQSGGTATGGGGGGGQSGAGTTGGASTGVGAGAAGAGGAR